MLNNKSILIIGGTGSLGQALTQYIFINYPKVKKLVILSRDEQKQFQMAQKYPQDKYPQIRFFIGDIRDYSRLKMAFDGIDYIIHAAAMKHIHISEYNPMECVKTNILGTENIISAALEMGITKVVSLSTDKASSPNSLYGATKLASDKLVISANNIKGERKIKFSVVRYGNILGSRGSVIPLFLQQKESGTLTITDSSMTRFSITPSQGIKSLLYALNNMYGGEIFVPKVPSFKLIDLVTAISSNCKHKIIGIRPGEKLHEEMISTSESYNTWEVGQYYIILPFELRWSFKNFQTKYNSKAFPQGESYNSQTNIQWENVASLKKLITKYCIT